MKKHECGSKNSETLTIFRMDTVGKPTRIGKYAECRVCGTMLKILTTISDKGRIRDVVMKHGDVIKTAGGEIAFKEGEEDAEKRTA